jgi:acetolactate synthase-1/2/3 large subunit
MSKQNLNGGDILAKCLQKEGISKIFGIVGGELLCFFDAIQRWGRDEGIETVMVRHEAAGAHAADAWARATGEIGVCLGTVGPGVTNLVPAVSAANADSIPMLIIGAQIGRMFEGTWILQGGVDQIAIMKPITKAQFQVEEPGEIPFAVQRAIKTAMTGRRGPVFLELRETALVRAASEEDLKKILDPEQYRSIYRPGGSPEAIKAAVEVLKNAKKPLIVAGGGVNASEAYKELAQLSETYSIPVSTSINGIGSISSDKKTFLDSYLVSSAYRTAAGQTDLVISLGCKWGFYIFYGTTPIWNPNKKMIQVDIDPTEIGRNNPVEVAIIGDIKVVINQLILEMENSLPKEKVSEWNEWNDYLRDLRKNDDQEIKELFKADKIPMKPERLILEVMDFIPPDAQIVLDGGDITIFSYKFMNYKPRPPRSVFFPVTMGHLGVNIPYAVGVQLAKPDKMVVCITGDGSMMFNIQELETAVRLNLPIIVVIANNQSWGMIKSGQKGKFKKRYIDVDFPEIDFVAIAKGFGCHAEKVIDPKDIKPALQRAVDSKKPAVIDIEMAFETPIATRVIGSYKTSKGLLGNK